MFANIHFRVCGNVITIIVQNIALDIVAVQFQITVVIQYNHVKVFLWLLLLCSDSHYAVTFVKLVS